MKTQLIFLLFQILSFQFTAQIDTNERSTNKTDENLYILKNSEDIIPFDKLNRNVRNVSFIDGKHLIGEKLNLFYKVDTFRVNPIRISDYNTIEKQDFNDILIVSYAPNPNDSIENYIKDLQFLNMLYLDLD